ncbi:MAG: substrate-binding domain-containing protein [Deltaproteobacteria bacterium]|nr:substrate-binding domain-containing protein [Deltaproteobacteria bacterium]
MRQIGWVVVAAAAVVSGAACRREAATAPRVALLLPESKTARYETQDWPHFRARLTALGMKPDDILYGNANQDPLAQRTQAEAALANGARVLVLDPVDSDAAAAVADLARARGVPVVAYDRLIKGTDAVTAYISFDNERVGRLQAEGLLRALGGRAGASVVMINGSPTDNNAGMFKRGAHAVLDGKVTVTREYDTPDWSPDKAQAQMQQALTALGNKVDGVYAANDGTAGGVIAALKAAGVSPLPPVTGQDAELAAIQRILVGEQALTVYKAIRPEAEAAAELAFRLATGALAPAAVANEPAYRARVDNGRARVPALLLEPVVVTRANVKDTVIKDGFWKTADVCSGDTAAACRELGIP